MARDSSPRYIHTLEDWSRARGPANLIARIAYSGLDQDLPSPFTSGAGRVLLNNWALNAFIVMQTGTPVTVFNRDSGQALGGLQSIRQSVLLRCGGGAPLVTPGDVAIAAELHQPGGVGTRATRPIWNSGRGMFRGPGQNHRATLCVKDFKIKEALATQFRTEFFNLLNMPNFSNPVNSMDAANFGHITTTSVNARLIQMALKVNVLGSTLFSVYAVSDCPLPERGNSDCWHREWGEEPDPLSLHLLNSFAR